VGVWSVEVGVLCVEVGVEVDDCWWCVFCGFYCV